MPPPKNETPEHRRERLDKRNENRRLRLLQETPDQKQQRADKKKVNYYKHRIEFQETPEQRRQRHDKALANETTEQRRTRLAKEKKRRQERERNETPEVRRRRLDRVNELRRKKVKDPEKSRFKRLVQRVTMTEEQKEMNRENRRLYDRANKKRRNFANISEEKRKRVLEVQKLWRDSLTGEKKRRYLESVRKATSKYTRKKNERIKRISVARAKHTANVEAQWEKLKQNGKMWQEYLWKRSDQYIKEAPEQTPTPTQMDNVNKPNKELKRKPEEKNNKSSKILERKPENKSNKVLERKPKVTNNKSNKKLERKPEVKDNKSSKILERKPENKSNKILERKPKVTNNKSSIKLERKPEVKNNKSNKILERKPEVKNNKSNKILERKPEVKNNKSNKILKTKPEVKSNKSSIKLERKQKIKNTGRAEKNELPPKQKDVKMRSECKTGGNVSKSLKKAAKEPQKNNVLAVVPAEVPTKCFAGSLKRSEVGVPCKPNRNLKRTKHSFSASCTHEDFESPQSKYSKPMSLPLNMIWKGAKSDPLLSTTGMQLLSCPHCSLTFMSDDQFRSHLSACRRASFQKNGK